MTFKEIKAENNPGIQRFDKTQDKKVVFLYKWDQYAYICTASLLVA